MTTSTTKVFSCALEWVRSERLVEMGSLERLGRLVGSEMLDEREQEGGRSSFRLG